MQRILALWAGLLLVAMLPSLATAATSTTNDLVSLATQQMQISKPQASGGLGVLFQLAQQNLSSGQFGSIKQQVPDMSGLLAAGNQAMQTQKSTQQGSLMGQAMSMFGHSSDTKLGPLSAYNALQSLGLSADQMGSLINLVENYLKKPSSSGSGNSSSGQQPASLFSQAMGALTQQPGIQ